jgi:1,4-dihydroxy-2-naphthoate octaprenyltransferase
MRLVKSTTLRNLLIICGLQLVTCNFLYAQENSPYSRYGLGDISPSTNIVNRGMGSLSAAYADPFPSISTILHPTLNFFLT